MTQPDLSGCIEYLDTPHPEDRGFYAWIETAGIRENAPSGPFETEQAAKADLIERLTKQMEDVVRETLGLN